MVIMISNDNGNYLNEINNCLFINLAEKLMRRYFDVSMTSCHHYQENEENLHK